MKAVLAALILALAASPALADRDGKGRGRDEARREQRLERKEQRGPKVQSPGRGRGRGQAAQGQGGWRRGQVLPPGYRRGVVGDPYRYGLYAAPRGHAWVRVGPDMYLMSKDSGVIREVVRDSY